MPLPVYRANDTDKKIVDNARKYDFSDITVNTISGKQRSVGSPTGAGDNRVISKAGWTTVWYDKIASFGDKAGKARASDSYPHS